MTDKERLALIESLTTIEDFGDYQTVKMDFHDFAWLMELAEKVEKLKAGVWLVANAELREEIKKLKETNFKMMGRLSLYSERIERYEQVLYEIIQTEKKLEIFTVSDIAEKALS